MAASPAAVAMLDQGKAALDDLIAVAATTLADYDDEDVVLMIVAAFAQMQPEAASAAAFAAIRLAKAGA